MWECGCYHVYPHPLLLLAENSIPLRILYEKYGDCLTESNLIKVQGLLIEPATNSYVLAHRDIYLENPEIKIRVRPRLDKAGVGRGRQRWDIPAPSRGPLVPQEYPSPSII